MDREFIFGTVKQQHGHALRYAASELKAGREIVFAAVKQHGISLEHATPELEEDREFMFEAVSKMCMRFDAWHQSRRRTSRSCSEP